MKQQNKKTPGHVTVNQPTTITSSTINQTGRHIRFTVLPLCCLVIIVCIYIPAKSTKFITPKPVPDLGIRRLAKDNTAQTGSPQNLLHITGSPDASRRVTRSFSKTPTAKSNNQGGYAAKSQHPRNNNCLPEEKIVFIKTHKTGSTTTASIFERFGYLRNLSFAMSKGGHIISNEHLFKRSMAYQIPNRTRHDFDMLVNHVRYNRNEMDLAVPGAKYVTILRNPVTQLESAFGYFEMGTHLKIDSENPFRTFMSEPKLYYEKKSYFWTRSRNGQMYDLGFEHTYDENVSKILEKIDQLSNEIDLVMITEYFDQSLILLRKLMCWDYSDILYISNGIRSESHRIAIDQDMANRIRAWSAADVMLYEHFNRTFWKKVNEYGPSFEEDLAHFREIESNVTDMCIDVNRNNTGDRREDKLTLKNNSKFCQDLMRADVSYTALIQKGMVNRPAEETARNTST